MRGWINLAGRDPFNERDADPDVLTLEEHSSRIVLSLTPELGNVARFVDDGAWPLSATGTVEIAALSLVLRAVGTLRLAVPASDRDQGTTMEYELECRAPNTDQVFLFSGRKYVRDNRGPMDIWSDTTRLDFVIYPAGHPDIVLGHGALRIGIGRLIRMVASMRRTAPASPPKAAPPKRAGWLRPQIRFTKAFNSHVLGEFGGLLNHGAEFRKLAATPPLPLPPMRSDSTVEHWYATGTPPEIGQKLDDIDWAAGQHSNSWLGLHRFRGGNKGPILLAAGYGMTSDSFAARVGPTDLMTYLFTRGYDVWLFDYRQSFRLPSHDSQFTMDEIALVDWPAAVAQVRRRTDADSVLVFAHCMGSLTAFMSLLAGLTGVRALVSSQVTAHVTMPAFSRFKAKTRVPGLMRKFGLNTVGPPRGTGLGERAWDLLMRPYPWLKGEQCHNPACRWVTTVYGPTHLHSNLSAAAHSQIGNMFGSAAVAPVAQITAIVRAGHLVDSQGRDVYMQRPDRLDLPIAFLRGTDNKIFTEPGPLKTISWLRSHNPDQDYQWIALDGFGHLDSLIGRDSDRRVFDKVLPFLEAYAHPDAAD
jgi:cholesterol oxidase